MNSDHEREKLNTETKVVAVGRPAKKPDGGLNPPIALNSTFHTGGPIGYARSGNETWSALEDAISSLEGGKTLIFSSGMAAIGAILSILPSKAIIVAAKNGYQGTTNILKNLQESEKLIVRFVDPTNTKEILAAIPGSQIIHLESPVNPLLDIIDLPQVIKFAKESGAGVSIDNTFATPMNQNPLAMGADICMHSVTKYLSGHSDVLLGSLSTNDPALYSRLEQARKYGGAIAGPFEAWLALRGIRTFAIRMQRSQENALELAKRLASDPRVSKVRYPGLASDPNHLVAKSFMKGFGAMISFEPKGTPDQVDLMCDSSKLITNATSLGGVESIWERRRRWETESETIPVNLIRFSVGIENVDDLWADIQSALNAAKIS
ncbi:MAG: aminotransferase class I/II-fold pyridoxal phosphate-dependent enzyme [Actinomycetota bacterium]|nr:aminotransferase class I/II-fold pyridoxal phosphate-dependent enzyme [Actinomycetota bacterium]